MITCPCPWYMLLVHKFSYICGHQYWEQVSWAWICNYIPQYLWNVIKYSCLRYLLLALRHILCCRTFLFNSLWPNDSIWQHRSRSTLAQVMACCLMAPSHYLNQCWLIFSKVKWHSVEGNLTRDSKPFNHWNKLENYLSKISFKSPRGQWVNSLQPGDTT